MKLLLPTAALFAASSVCCCGSLQELLEKNGVGGDTPAADHRVMASVPANEIVRIVDIQSEDAYFAQKDTLIGRACVTDEASSYTDGGWQGGQVHCGTDSYYFYKAAYEDLGPSPTPLPTPTPTVDNSGVPVPAIPGVHANTSLSSGTRVKILDLHSDDAYYADRASILGKLCTLSEAAEVKEGGWYAGQTTCDDGSSYYFYKAAYEVQGGAAAPAAPTASTADWAKHSLPNGERVRIMDVAPDDAYYSDRATMIGKTCTLAEDSSFKDGMWHGGSVNCDTGENYYFYKAAYKDLGAGKATPAAPAAPAGPAHDGRIEHAVPSGAHVKVVDVATDDAYYADRASIIGKTCTLSGTSSYYDGGWQGGQVTCDDGSSYYFYKAAYVMAGGGARSGGGGGADGRVQHKMPKGAHVTIVDVAPDDAYYADRASIIGKGCTLDESSSYKEDGAWQGGQVHCDDGSSYYFYKAAYAAK